MGSPRYFSSMLPLSLLVLILLSLSGETSAEYQSRRARFLHCLSSSSNSSTISRLVYPQSSPSYSSVLNATLQNTRFSTPTTPKPFLIITPLQASHVQSAIRCSKRHGFEIRIRSGGHDYEGLSYVARVPFIILDLINFRAVEVDTKDQVAWVESGAILGELYYAIANKSDQTLAFPAGICHTVGIGGYFTGGGYGLLFRKYGLAADNVIDARLVDVNGRILDRKSMGEDLFWAIRGGGGNTFGVVLAWKVRLVPVPAVVTVFTVTKTLEQNLTGILHRWQYIAHELPDGLFAVVTTSQANSSQEGKKTVQGTFQAMFLGGVDELIPLFQDRFPELGLSKEDCTEMSWFQAVLYFRGLPTQNLEILLDRNAFSRIASKIKSDYVKEPIPESGLEGIFSKFHEKGADGGLVIMVAFGGRMAEIPEDELPYPHRAGNLYQLTYISDWTDVSESETYISWMRRLQSYLTPYVSKSPRESYFNYRDLDIGRNNDGYTSFEQASIWGRKYFKNNFERLVYVKTMVDPTNFFRTEQSVPPLSSPPKKKKGD